MGSSLKNPLAGRMLFVIDVREGRVVDAAASVQVQSGWASDQLIDCAWSDFIHPEDRAGVVSAGRRVLEKKYCRWACRMRHSDGSYVHYHCDATLGSDTLSYIWACDAEKLAAEKQDLWQYQRLSELTDDLLVVSDHLGRIVAINAAAERTHGISQREWLGKSLADFVTDEGKKVLDEIPERFRKGERSIRFIVPAYAANGDVIMLEGYTNWDADSRRWFTIERDITERVRREQELEISQRFFDLSPGQLVLLDNTGLVLRANPAFSQFVDQRFECVVDQPVQQLLGQTDASLQQALEQVVATGDMVELTLQTDVAGQRRALKTTLMAASDGESLFFSSRDITEELRLNGELMDRATRDQLTRLANRAVFNQTLDEMLLGGQVVAVMVLDLDNFKRVNDGLGHEAGDELLRLVADRLLATLRSDDLVARFGGDEFVVLLRGTRAQQEAETVAEKVRLALAEPHLIGGREVSATTSLGVAIGMGKSHSASQLFREADAAAYKAKHLGRNRVQMFDSALRESVQLQQSTEVRLRTALKRDAFDLDVQAIYTIDGDFWGIEGLARLVHEDGARSGPETFLDVASQLGLLSTLGEVIFDRALRLLGPWLNANPAVTLSLNTSATEIGTPGFFAMVMGVIERQRVRPRQLMLEVSENGLIASAGQGEHALDKLREAGIRIAIANFGTGASSLAHLRDQKVDQLKIDGSFIRCLANDRIANRITASIINLARELNIDVVAEGIESREQLDVLRDLGCPLLQGFLFHRHTRLDGFLDNADTLSGPQFALKKASQRMWQQAG